MAPPVMIAANPLASIIQLSLLMFPVFLSCTLSLSPSDLEEFILFFHFFFLMWLWWNGMLDLRRSFQAIAGTRCVIHGHDHSSHLSFCCACLLGNRVCLRCHKSARPKTMRITRSTWSLNFVMRHVSVMSLSWCCDCNSCCLLWCSCAVFWMYAH